MAKAREFLPNLMPLVPGCPIPLACDAVRDAIIALCARTHLWRARVTGSVVAGDPNFFPVLPDGSVIDEVESVWFNGQKLCPIAYSELSPTDLEREDAPPRFFTQGENLYRFIFYPRGDGDVIMSVWLKPDARVMGYLGEWPDMILTHYQSEVVAGAAARLLSMPDKTWSDPGLAAFHGGAFDLAIDRLIHKVAMGQQRRPLRTRARYL